MSVETERSPRTAYEALAPYYDRFTAHHRYEAWTASIEALARRHGVRGTRLLDLACGTGKSFAPFAARGWSVTACDVSPAMLARAADRAPAGVRLLERDIRELEPVGAFDLVTALCDVANYLLGPDDLAAAFAGAAANLAPGGVLVFDANTLRSYRTFFATTDVLDDGDLLLLWRGGADAAAFAEGDLAPGALDAFERDGDGWRRTSGEHLQRHHGRAELEAALAEAGLEVAGTYGQHLDGRIDEGADEDLHTKTLYVATTVRR
jgi:SAM-dependent methyltransferase